MIRTGLVITGVALLAIAAALGQTKPFAPVTQQMLENPSPNDWLMFSRTYDAQRFSPLEQINKQNVGKMVPVWSYSLNDLQGGEGFPVVKDGVIYVTTHNATAAVDALTGKAVWRVVHEYPPDALKVVCCGIVNRGAAIYEGLIIRALMDNRLTALDAKTGKELWTHNNGIGHVGGIISYRAGGKQYIAVATGWGSLVGDEYGALFGEPFTSMPKDAGALVVFGLP